MITHDIVSAHPRQYCSGADSRIFRVDFVNTVAADPLAPRVARPSSTHVTDYKKTAYYNIGDRMW